MKKLNKRTAVKQLKALAEVAPVRLSKKALRKQNKERVAHLERQGFSRKQAQEVVAHTDKLAPEGTFIPGMMVQFYFMGLRLGYIADVPQAGAVRIQPLGPKGAEFPSRVTVRLSDVHAVEEQYLKHGENTMTAIAAKAKELKQQSDQQREQKAAKLAENLAKSQRLTMLLWQREQKAVKLAENLAKDSTIEPSKAQTGSKKAKTAAAKEAAPATKKKAPKAAKKAGRQSLEETAKISAGKESPYREGSARAELLNKALKAKTVGAFLKSAGEPSGGSARAYLHLFVREGVVKIG